MSTATASTTGPAWHRPRRLPRRQRPLAPEPGRRGRRLRLLRLDRDAQRGRRDVHAGIAAFAQETTLTDTEAVAMVLLKLVKAVRA